MKKLRNLIARSFITGVLVLLPVAALVVIFRWIFAALTDAIQPFTNLVVRHNQAPELLADFTVISIMILACLLIGVLVSTSAGRLIHNHFDNRLLRFAPGYKMLKEIVNQFFGDKADSPFSRGQVALVHIFGRDVATRATALVTSEHADGTYTVFVPTGPNPTSGFIYHVPADCVEFRSDIAVDSMLKTVISCGAGSGDLFDPPAASQSTVASSTEQQA